MSKNKIYKYFVEGECEQKLINALKIFPTNCLLAGKVEVFNFINEKITPQRLAILKPKTIIILVYDIDIEKTDILEYNIKKLKECGFKTIHHIQSIKNFEEEIVFATSVRNVNEIFNTVGRKEFKAMFLKQNDIISKLNKYNFDVNKLWSRVNNSLPFSKYSSNESLVLIKKVD